MAEESGGVSRSVHGDLTRSISIGRLARWLLVGVATLAVVNGLLGLLQLAGVDDDALWFRLFDLNVEGNVPTWYTSALLALACFVATLVYCAYPPGDRHRRHWLGIAALFGFLSIDEVAQIHESWNALGRHVGTTATVVWVVPALLLASVLAAVYFRFWLAQDPTVRVLMFGGALVYTIGAVGAELATFFVVDRFGAGILSGMLVIMEETLEMIGAVAFLAAWLLQLRALRGRVVLDLT